MLSFDATFKNTTQKDHAHWIRSRSACHSIRFLTMRRASSAAAAARFFAVLSYLFRPFAWVLLRRRATRHGTDPSEGGRLFSGTPTTGRRRSKRLSKDETKWLFPHRIDPLLNDDNDEIVRRVRSGRSERSCHVWFENGCVSFRVFGVLSRSKRRARVLSLSLSLLPSSADATTSIAHV